MDGKQQAGGPGATGAPPSRRTPVKVSGGSRFPSLPLAIAGGVIILAGLIVYLIWQSNQSGDGLTASQRAEQDRSTSLPGLYVDTQGRDHLSGGLNASFVKPFCDGVPQSELAKERSGKPYTPLGGT